MTDHTHIDARLDNALEEAFGITYINHDSRAYKIMEALINDAVRAELGKALEAGEGTDFANQMAGTCGYVAERYAALSKEKETKDD